MRSIKNNQQGIVSIIISVVIMIVLSLIVISFTQLMRREQRQALDRQLSSQAFYAAETAVNDARKAFYEGGLQDKDTCAATDGPLSKRFLDEDSLVQYSCVVIISTPTSLVYDSISTDRSTVVEVKALSAAKVPVVLNSMTISWEDIGGATGFPGGTPVDLQTAEEWGNKPGMLRLEIAPLPVSGFNREYLRDNTQVYYLYPSRGGGSISWDSSGTANGSIIGGNCNAGDANRDRDCRVTISNLPLGAGDSYIVRMRSIYKPVSVTIAGITSTGNALFSNAQTLIDATGKANDVLRRIQERLPLAFSYDYPEYALDIGDDLCKRLEAEPASVTTESSVVGISACGK